MTTPPNLDPAIARYAATPFDDSTSLRQAGIDSSALLRLAVEVASNDDTEIDGTRLLELRTVGDLKRWLRALAEAPPC